MSPSLRWLLVGHDDTPRGRWLTLAVVLFVVTFAAYAVDVFEVSGGVVFVPAYAALVGVVAAGVVGTRRGGLVFGWLVCYAALLGFHADHAFVGLSNRTRAEQFAYFLGSEGLVVFAVMACVLGTLAFGVGALCRWSYDALRQRGVAGAD